MIVPLAASTIAHSDTGTAAAVLSFSAVNLVLEFRKKKSAPERFRRL